MAKRKSKSRTPKIQPAVLTMQFNLSTTPDASYVQDTIDLSQCASALNRRFYRQGLNWAVAGFSVLTKGTGSVTIQKIPNSWAASNSWEKSMRAWLKQQNEAVDDAGAQSAVARYRDFKIFADSIQHGNASYDGSGNITNLNNLMPVDITGTEVLQGEWEMSQIVIPNFGAPGVNYEPYMHMVGNDVGGTGGSKSLIKVYENSRAFPQSPDPVSPDIGSNENWLQSMFDVGDNNEEVLDNATDKNDNLPYDQDNYPGGDTNMPYLEIVDEAYVTSTSIGGKTTLKGSNFPCGLVRIRNKSNNAGDPGANPPVPGGWEETPKLLVHLVPGTHRGYLCQSMADM